MVNDGSKGSSADDCFVKAESNRNQQNLMESGERGFSDMYRNSSEDLFLKSLMESSIGMPIPTMEMLGLKNLSQNLRTDSEELFKSWLTNGENHGCNSSNTGHCNRQASRRISTELFNLSNQQHGGVLQKKISYDNLFSQNNSLANDISGELNQNPIRNAVENGFQASNLYLAKAWFHSSQPMTRSRSSELRKKYAAMQSTQTTIGIESMNNASGHGVNKLKPHFPNPNAFSDLNMCQIPTQVATFMSPSNSSSSTFNAPQMGNFDNVSSVVSMLKGTLERKKLGNQIGKEPVKDSSNGLYHAQEVIVNNSINQGQGNHFPEMPGNFQEVSPFHVKDPALLQTVEGSIDLDLEGFVNPANQMQLSTVSQEPSRSESSAAAPVVSSSFNACDGPSNSSQTLSICESSRKEIGNSRSSENGPRHKDFREQIMDNLKDDRKGGKLVRYGSVTSAASADKGDPTKKRRVERSRKMAEAKERNLKPAIPTAMQSVLKRCESLEKEVRSLKLNLSFMNRKDSEQTKQIEEIQKQNEELADEKERLLEEIERILSETGRM